MPVWQQVMVGIIPSIGVGLLFWFVMRGVVRADRNERAAIAEQEAQLEAAEKAAAARQAASAPASSNSGENSAHRETA